MKTQVINWGKILAQHISDKELVFRIYKELLKFNNSIIRKQIVQLTRGKIFKPFTKEDIWMANSWNWTWNNRLVPNRERSTSRLYIVTLLV